MIAPTPSARPALRKRALLLGMSALLMSACLPEGTPPLETIPPEELTEDGRSEDGRCWSEITPAQVNETDETREGDPQDNSDALIAETVCPEDIDADFIASLQRALKARDVYDGPDNGAFGPLTKASLQRYQRDQGTDIDLLLARTARDLGLLPVLWE